MLGSKFAICFKSPLSGVCCEMEPLGKSPDDLLVSPHEADRSVTVQPLSEPYYETSEATTVLRRNLESDNDLRYPMDRSRNGGPVISRDGVPRLHLNNGAPESSRSNDSSRGGHASSQSRQSGRDSGRDTRPGFGRPPKPGEASSQSQGPPQAGFGYQSNGIPRQHSNTEIDIGSGLTGYANGYDHRGYGAPGSLDVTPRPWICPPPGINDLADRGASREGSQSSARGYPDSSFDSPPSFRGAHPGGPGGFGGAIAPRESSFSLDKPDQMHDLQMTIATLQHRLYKAEAMAQHHEAHAQNLTKLTEVDAHIKDHAQKNQSSAENRAREAEDQVVTLAERLKKLESDTETMRAHMFRSEHDMQLSKADKALQEARNYHMQNMQYQGGGQADSAGMCGLRGRACG